MQMMQQSPLQQEENFSNCAYSSDIPPFFFFASRFRQVQCAELSKKAGWRAALKSVVFGGGAPPLAALRCLSPPGGGSTGGMLVLTARSLALWRNNSHTSGSLSSSSSSLSGAVLDFAGEIDDLSMSCQQRLESALLSDGVPGIPPVLHDVVTAINGSACWVLAESTSPSAAAGSGGSSYGQAARLSIHRVTINTNKSSTVAPALEVGSPTRSGDVDLVLLELKGPSCSSSGDGGEGGAEPAILPEWPSDVKWEMVPSSSGGSGSGSVPCQWLLCKDSRANCGQVLGVFELQPSQMAASNTSSASSSRTSAWRRPNGTGFTSERFVRRFPACKSDKVGSATASGATAMVSGSGMAGPESATTLSEDRLLCAGALAPSGEVRML